MAEQHHEHGAGADTEERGEDGKAHRQQRSERDEKDHHGGQDSDALACARSCLVGSGRDRPVQLDLQIRAPEPFGRVDQGLGRLGRQVAGLLVERDGGVADRPVGAGPPEALIGRVKRHHMGNAAGSDLSKQLLHLGPHRGVRYSSRRAEHDVGGVARPRRESRLEQIERRHRVRMATAEVIAVGVADRPAEYVQRHKAPDPQHHDKASVPIAPTRQPG